MRKPKFLQLTISYREGRQPKRLEGRSMEVKTVKTSRLGPYITKLNRGKIARITITRGVLVLFLVLFLVSCSLPKRIPRFQENATMRVRLVGWEFIHKPAGRIRLDLVNDGGDTIHYLTVRPRYQLRVGLKYRFGYDSALHAKGDTLRGSLKLLNL